MKTYYDWVIQCGRCEEVIESGYMTEDMPHLGDKTFCCHLCAERVEEEFGKFDDEFVITKIDSEATYTDRDELIEWFDNRRRHAVDMGVIANHFDWDEEAEQYVPDGNVQVVALTVWAFPPSAMPDRDWLTVKEAADLVGKSKNTFWTQMQRDQYFDFQVKGYIQKASTTTLIHKKVIELELKIIDFFRDADGIYTLQEVAEAVNEQEFKVLKVLNRASRDVIELVPGIPVGYKAGRKLRGSQRDVEQ